MHSIHKCTVTQTTFFSLYTYKSFSCHHHFVLLHLALRWVAVGTSCSIKISVSTQPRLLPLQRLYARGHALHVQTTGDSASTALAIFFCKRVTGH